MIEDYITNPRYILNALVKDDNRVTNSRKSTGSGNAGNPSVDKVKKMKGPGTNRKGAGRPPKNKGFANGMRFY